MNDTVYPNIECPDCQRKGVVKAGVDWFNCQNCGIGFYLDEAEIDPAVKAAREYDEFLANPPE